MNLDAFDQAVSDSMTAAVASFPDTLHAVVGVAVPAAFAVLALVAAWKLTKRWVHA